MLIRNVTVEDADALSPLLGHLGYPADGAQMAERLARLLGDPAYAAWVVETEGQLGAFASAHVLYPIEMDAPAAQLMALVTAPDRTGRGVGSALVRHFEEWARDLGASGAVISSGAQRSDAHHFYERLGYAATGVRFKKMLNG